MGNDQCIHQCYVNHHRHLNGDRRPILIALTGYGQPEDKRRASEAGFDSLLVKPVDPAALTDLLATLEIPARGFRG